MSASLIAGMLIMMFVGFLLGCRFSDWLMWKIMSSKPGTFFHRVRVNLEKGD